MRIGILTLMHGYNYGGVLQCYGVKRALECQGHNVEVIDFHPRPGWRKARHIAGYLGSVGERLAVDLISAKKYGKQIHRSFQDFRRNRLNLSPPCNSTADLQRLMQRYDAMVVGSDQVWNLDWAIPEYFFSFANDYQGKLFSYAACFGHRKQSSEVLEAAGSWLTRFDAISVRNGMSQSIVKNASKRDSMIVADPTLLVSFDDMVEAPELPFDDYILLYALSNARYHDAIDHLKAIATKKDLPIVAVQSDVLQNWDMSAADYCVKNPSVEQWLGLFQNACFVLTDSFHGTLFSIKNHVPFLNYIGTATSSERVAYVAQRYGLANGYYPPDQYDHASVIDFNSIDRQIQIHIDESYKFIQQMNA